MTILEMFEQSAILTLLGMTMVFAFLWIMVICVTWVGKIVHALGLDKDVRPESETTKSVNTGTPEIAAIAAAITEYRRKEDSGE
jgi:oxaloacetate decarboxylase gamma subunit